jgi:hypothetical protein
VILQCEKLMSLGLAERRDVREKSGLCTFCLKHAAELECYGRGGLSKPRCTQAGCDGEHTTDVHKLMGEDGAGVNVIAGDESEDEDETREEDEDEGWWVGTVGAVETPDWAGRAPCDDPSVGQARDDEHGVAEDGSQVEYGHDPLPGECSAGEMAEDEWWEMESDCPSLEEDKSGATWPEAMQYPLRATSRPTRPGSTGRQKLRKRPRTDADRNWEDARRSAWVRQLLSDDSSDEDKSEERYGRFAESGRWMSELYGFP